MAAPATAAVSALRMRRPRDTASKPASRTAASSPSVQPPLGPTSRRTEAGAAADVTMSLSGRPPCSLRKRRRSVPGARRSSASGRGGWISVRRRDLHCLAASRAIRRQRSSFRSVLSSVDLEGARGGDGDEIRTAELGGLFEDGLELLRLHQALGQDDPRPRRSALLLHLQDGDLGPVLPDLLDPGQDPSAAAVEEPDLVAGPDPGRPGQMAVLDAFEDDPGRALGEAGTKNWLAVTLLVGSLQDVLQPVHDALVDRFDVLAPDLGELGQERLLVLGQVLRGPDEDLDEEVAPAPAGDVLDALAL